jgi:branched-chain amino acid transport system ATP-binding protein
VSLLAVRGLHARYGQVEVLEGIDLDVEEGEIVTILGANGTGKTTTLRALSGMIPVRGEIRLRGERIDGQPPERLVRRGIAHVPEGRGTFAALTVEENLRLGAYTRRDAAGVEKDLAAVHEYFPVLRDRREQRAGSLSGGEQQMLAVARALMGRPLLLLLDEPSLGLAPQVTRTVFDIVRRVNDEQGVTTVIVEQNADLALRAARRAYVLERGRIAMSGAAEDLARDDSIRRVYLGY